MTDLPFMAAVQERRLAELAARGVQIIDPRQTYVDASVVPERIHAGVILHPGTRLSGARTFFAPRAELGREGPVTAVDCVLGEGARIDGGHARGAVLLRGASAGCAAHLREGTLLEEEAVMILTERVNEAQRMAAMVRDHRSVKFATDIS